MAQDVLGLLDRLEISRVYLVGWSDVGVIGLDLAMTQPERLAGLFTFGANADVSGLKKGAEKTGVDRSSRPLGENSWPFSAQCAENLLANAEISYHYLRIMCGDLNVHMGTY